MMTIALTTAPGDVTTPDLKRTARLTGVFYLGLALTGLFGFLIVRDRLFVADNPAATLANLTGRAVLARVGVALEMGVVLTQALCALWFHRLFRSVDDFAAGALAAFGLINAIMILVSAAMLATTLTVAGDASLAAARDTAATTQLLYVISGHLWGVASIFFGLWLIPMGWLVLHSGWMPRPLGWVLIVGGVGYVISAFVPYLLPAAQRATQVLTMPASVGEFWMVGYLLVYGVRDKR